MREREGREKGEEGGVYVSTSTISILPTHKEEQCIQ